VTKTANWALISVLALAVLCALTLPAGTTTAAPAAQDDFTEIFNGKDLSGWEGDPRLWSVEDGAIRGETTEEKKADGNTFLIWQGGTLKNFVLKLKFRVEEGNSGVQYRSSVEDQWRVVGYQAEVDNQLGDVGELYDEGKRAHLARVGQFTIIGDDGNRQQIGQVASKKHLEEAGYYQPGEWNEYTIIARGNHLAQYINGYQTVEVIDNDPDGRAMEGVLALQLHAGPPMAVEYKDIRVRQLDQDYGEAFRLFNGKNLEGWTCPIEGAEEAWNVKDGAIATTGSPVGYIRTTDKYTNYVLRLQYRHITEGNGGVLLRVHGEDKVWPRSMEAQGWSTNVGDIFHIGGFPMKTDPERTHGRRTQKLHDDLERPIGNWNNYEIYVNGGNLRIYLNRVLQNYAEECKVVPGHIGLQSEGSRMQFRNIVLIPIESPEQD